MAQTDQTNGNGSGGAAKPSSLRRPASVRRLASTLVARAEFAARNGLSFQGANGIFRRDMNVALGYKEPLDVPDYRGRFQRGGIAKRLVALLPMETWAAEGIELVEDPDPGTTTAFEEAFADLAARLGLWSRLLRADILAGMGRYSALLIGAPGDMATPMPRLSGPDAILYFTPLAEDNATIHALVKNPEDERFGLPESYDLKLGGDDSAPNVTVGTAQLTKVAHWSRVVHIAEGLLENDVYGEPRLRAIWNYLDDLAKIVGGGAEATWKRLHPLTLFDKDPEIEMTDRAEDLLEDQIEEIIHDLKPYALTSGITPHILSQAVQGFGPNADAVLQLISATTGIPKRILAGSERGELASSQDRDTFAELVVGRRLSVGTPIVRALVDRLVEYGALPEPAEYEVVWPEMDEMPESEKAEIVGKLAAANQANVAAGGGLIATANEIRDGVLGMGPIEEIEDTGTEALDEPEDDVENDEPAVTVNASLRAAKLRLCAARGLTFRRAEFDLADVAADEPEWKAVHRAADLHRDSLARAVLGAWEDGGDAIDAGEIETALVEIDAGRLADTLNAALAGISTDSENADAARQTAISDALAAGRADRAVTLATAGITAAEDRLAEILPDRLLATLIDGGLAALRSARSRGSFFRGAEAAVEGLAGFSASFDSANPRAIDWAADRSSALITEIGPETLAAMRELIAFGIAEGVPPRQLARQIRQAVGLRSDQVRAVQNLIKRMAAAEPGDLIMAGKTRIRIPREGVSQALIDKRAGEYGKRLRQQRALLVARTETLRSANAGQKELWLQSQESGQLPTDIEREWLVTPDDRLRPEHAAMAGQRRRIDEPFVTPAGRQLEPGEDPACRCAQGLVRAQRARAAA